MNNKKFNEKKINTNNFFIIDDNTPFIIKEAYKNARTNLMFSLASNEKKVVLFSSCSPSEGRTTSCVNMALALASTGSKVLIIDADLRKPSIHKIFNLNNKHGLSSAISGFVSLDKIHHLNVKNSLDVITAGPIPPNPSELLASNKMTSIIETLSEQYDYICIDTPPINMMSDALLLSPLASGIFFILKENATTHGELKKALESIKLTNGKILGFLKTNCSNGMNISKKKKKYYFRKKTYNYPYNYPNDSTPQTI